VEGNANVSAEDLAGLPVLIDGRAVTRTRRGGRFFVGNLRPGVYRVEIDPEGMPIELTLRQPGRRARVEPGAVTGVDFVATQEFGFAGRVLVEGQPFANALVELLDQRGNVIQTAKTDRFGLYRFDGVVAGRYRVRMSPRNAPGADVTWPTRDVLVEDFLFGQDLVLRRIDIREQSMPDGLSGGGQAGGATGSGNDSGAGPSGFTSEPGSQTGAQ